MQTSANIGDMHGRRSEAVLSTILFTDLVESTALAVRFGEERWCELVDRYDAMAVTVVERLGGTVVRLTGDGLIATFSAGQEAVASSVAMMQGLRQLGLEARSGLHTGWCRPGRYGPVGIAFHVSARVMALARPGETLVTDAARSQVENGSLHFRNRGWHSLRGLPGQWRLWAANVPSTYARTASAPVVRAVHSDAVRHDVN